MYGLIVKLTSTSGRRDELITLLGGEDSRTVPGCLSFIVARDAHDEDVLWVTEVWSNQASHEASLEAPQVKDNLSRLDHLIKDFNRIATTHPVPASSHPLYGDPPAGVP